MKPWEILARATTPAGAELVLARRGDEHVIRVDGRVLMSSRQHGSEEEMAHLACERLQSRTAPRVLIGGLGLGFTLRAALDCLPPTAELVVGELVPALVEWNRGLLAPLAGSPLSDARVRVVEGDVAALIAGARAEFDAILLDVDNGPSALTSPANARLYGPSGLRAARRALRAQGLLCLWSAGPDEAFAARLRESGFSVEVAQAGARGPTGGTRHVLFLAVPSA